MGEEPPENSAPGSAAAAPVESGAEMGAPRMRPSPTSGQQEPLPVAPGGLIGADVRACGEVGNTQPAAAAATPSSVVLDPGTPKPQAAKDSSRRPQIPAPPRDGDVASRAAGPGVVSAGVTGALLDTSGTASTAGMADCCAPGQRAPARNSMMPQAAAPPSGGPSASLPDAGIASTAGAQGVASRGVPPQHIAAPLAVALNESMAERSGGVAAAVAPVDGKESDALAVSCDSDCDSGSSDSSDSSPSSSDSDVAERARIKRALALAEAAVEQEDAGPVRSKNERDVDGVTVPPLDLEVTDEHKLVPVGRILSIMSKALIIESLPGALGARSGAVNPYAAKPDSVSDARALDADTVLVLVESRLAFGRVFETFGPVVSPFYVVRFNSEREVEELGEAAAVGKQVAFIAGLSHLVRAGDIRNRGYDASNLHDEELAGDRQDYSDDEAEAASKRAKKRPTAGTRGASVSADDASGGGGRIGGGGGGGGGDAGRHSRPSKRYQQRDSAGGPGRGGSGYHPSHPAPPYRVPAYGQSFGAAVPPAMPHPSAGASSRRIFHNGVPAPSIHPMLAQQHQQRMQFPLLGPDVHGQAPVLPPVLFGAAGPPPLRSQPQAAGQDQGAAQQHYREQQQPMAPHGQSMYDDGAPTFPVQPGYPVLMPAAMYSGPPHFGPPMYHHPHQFPPHPLQQPMLVHPMGPAHPGAPNAYFPGARPLPPPLRGSIPAPQQPPRDQDRDRTDRR
jgi:H/ACA ribonucleoprotein complex non-core subunit NAF1